MPVTSDPRTFTNRIPSPANGGVVAVVFDQLNTLPMDQAHARENLLKYLASIRPDDRVALYLLTGDGVRCSTTSRATLRAW